MTGHRALAPIALVNIAAGMYASLLLPTPLYLMIIVHFVRWKLPAEHML